MLGKIEIFLVGKKVYLLMLVGALAAVTQYGTGFSFGIPALPVAANPGELIGELWAFAAASGFRAAIAKVGK